MTIDTKALISATPATVALVRRELDKSREAQRGGMQCGTPKAVKVDCAMVERLCRIAEKQADRLAALENERNVSMGIGDGSGQRFVYGTYEAIKAAQAVVLRKEALEAELAESLQKIADLRAISNVNGDWTLKVKALEAENQRLLEALEGVLGEALTYQLRESDLVVETARAAIAKAKGGDA